MVPATRQRRSLPPSADDIDDDPSKVRPAVIDPIGAPAREHPRHGFGNDFLRRVGIPRHQPGNALDPRQLDRKHLHELAIGARQLLDVMLVDR